MNALVFASEHWRDHDGWWFPLFPLLFIGLWAFVIVAVTRRWRQPAGHAGESALAERFARGEIDEAEYRARRQVLRSKS
jgi:putative membrane protein